MNPDLQRKILPDPPLANAGKCTQEPETQILDHSVAKQEEGNNPNPVDLLSLDEQATAWTKALGEY